MTQAFSAPSTVSSVSVPADGTAATHGKDISAQHQAPEASLSPFVARHLGPTAAEQAAMLAALGYDSLDELMAATVPATIRLQHNLDLPKGLDEAAALAKLKTLASQNQVWRSYLGLGYANTLTPGVIQRNVLENPGWYTQYTPYQPEISQGRLEALLNYQTLITDLTGMEIANASLLDEGTAAAEAMTLAFNARKKKDATTFWVSEACHPQTIDVVRTRAIPLGIEVVVGDHRSFDFSTPVFGVLLQYPATDGAIYDYEAFIAQAHAANALATVAADLISLTLLRPLGNLVRISWWATANGSVCPWAMVAPTPPSLRPATPLPVSCPVVWWAFLKIATVPPPCASRCKPESNTSAAMPPPATSAPPKCCWRSWPACMRSTTGRRA